MTTRRRVLITSALGALLVPSALWPAAALAQRRAFKLGMISARSLAASAYAGQVVRRLEELGYREANGTRLEFRSADGYADRYPTFARELIALKCDLIFAVGPEHPVRALQDARSPAPIVFLAVDYDPMEKAVVGSLREPDRNTTGVYVPSNELAGKRVEIMREVVPSARRFLLLSDPFSRDQVAGARKVASARGLHMTVVDFAKPPYDFPAAFETGVREQAQAFVALSSPVFAEHGATLAELASRHRLPSIGTVPHQVNSGFLLSFSANPAKAGARAAEIAVRILKGAKPQTIPVEQADEFELVVSAKTARALGVTIPGSVLARATRVVQ